VSQVGVHSQSLSLNYNLTGIIAIKYGHKYGRR
jgi:hypothetical protein